MKEPKKASEWGKLVKGKEYVDTTVRLALPVDDADVHQNQKSVGVALSGCGF
jgi:hypothetical protein